MSSQHSRLISLPTYQSVSTSRLKSLYSDFLQQKHSNPTSFASNLEWWRRTLESVVLKGWQSSSYTDVVSADRLILTAAGPSFSEEFRYEGVGRPLSLAGIIAELTENKSYVPLNQFFADSRSIYDPGWLPLRIASLVIGKPIWWALQQLSIVNPDEYVGGHAGDNERWKKVKGQYVVLSLLERAGEGILQKQQAKNGVSLADSLFKLESFKKEYADSALPGLTLSDLDVRVVLKFLERDKGAVAIQGETIKFLAYPGAMNTEITAVDTGILELKTGIENLQAQVNEIQVRIEKFTRDTKQALQTNRKEIALSNLRLRKQAEALLPKRLNSLETLQSTLMRVEAAAGDVEIMRTYETSAATLRAVLQHPLLQREKIDETMEAMASASADAQEIDDAVRAGAGTSLEPDESELEAELQGLVAAAEEERKEAERKQLEKRLAGLRIPSHASEDNWTDHEMDEEYQQVRKAKLAE